MSRALSAVLAAVVLLAPAFADAQGTLSAQGFGYPPGQLSTRARGTAGAFGEFDPQSPLNPAALAAWGRPGLFFQYDPEFRRSTVGNAEDRASTSRFPVIAGGLPIKRSLMFGLSSSTLLDRTWSTQFSRRELIGTDSVTFNESSRSIGAINDGRLGVGWSPSSALRVGGALHFVSGENTLRIRREFIGTEFDTLDQRASRGYSGLAASVGLETRITGNLAIAGSYRHGGTMRAYSGDTTVAKAKVPSRLGAGLRFEGIRGLAIGLSGNWTQWSSLRDLGSSSLSVDDAIDLGVGVEGRGPRWFENNIPLRAGYRRRTLPFTVPGRGEITESDVTAGFGIPLARTRSNFDFGIERAARWGAGGVSETAWTLSFGILVRQ